MVKMKKYLLIILCSAGAAAIITIVLKSFGMEGSGGIVGGVVGGIVGALSGTYLNDN